MKRVVVTGSAGLIGRMLMDAWRDGDRYEAVGLARSEGDYTDVLADTTDLDALVEAFTRADAVVHLAGSSEVSSIWDDVLQNNIIGLRNVFEAAKMAGVKRVVFSSSNHAVGTFETANQPDIWDINDGRQIDHTSRSYWTACTASPKPMAKQWCYYVDHHGLEIICLRIGGCMGTENDTYPALLWDVERDNEPRIREKRMRVRAVWLSNRDCVHLIERSIEAEVSWALVYGISDNPRKLWDIEHAREVLGYQPQDAAPRELFPGVE
ncbi:MAG: NAD(P)-dependent oxidoreductase [Thermomicrobiales bacterium]|nr:NAD(P)-dependent oxidoreductase [Thermomicrobiales bacterium]